MQTTKNQMQTTVSPFLSPTCAPDLGDIATYFFWKIIFLSDTGIGVTMNDIILFVPWPIAKWRHCNTYSGIGSIFFSKKKYVPIYPRPAGAHVRERSLLLLSTIRRGYRQTRRFCPELVFVPCGGWRHCNTHSGVGSKYLFRKKRMWRYILAYAHMLVNGVCC